MSHFSDGYCFIRMPSHPRAKKNGYVKRAIINYENFYGVNVPRDMVVHHIDGNRRNDDPINLVMLYKEEHDPLNDTARKQVCKYGHPLVYPNLNYSYGINGYTWVYKTCSREYYQKHREEKKKYSAARRAEAKAKNAAITATTGEEECNLNL